MKKNIIFFALALISTSAFSADKRSIVYKVVGINKAQSTIEWTSLKTISGSSVNVRCKTGDFDDSVRDRVGGFKSTQACEQFLLDVAKYANSTTPIDVEINESFGIDYTINF